MPLATPLPPPLPPPPEQSRLSPARSLCLFRNIIPLIAGRQEKAGAAASAGSKLRRGARPAPVPASAPTTLPRPVGARREPPGPVPASFSQKYISFFLSFFLIFFSFSHAGFPPFHQLLWLPGCGILRKVPFTRRNTSETPSSRTELG